ncbi:MAG TPA: hypothetical protein VLH18_01255 [Candidatus Limnocylindrales bacterium]|nr:hypothetical protein [Candidatus Limnocylindrales bacterium]
MTDDHRLDIPFSEGPGHHRGVRRKLPFMDRRQRAGPRAGLVHSICPIFRCVHGSHFFVLSGYGLAAKYLGCSRFPWKTYAANRFAMIVVP